jgi:manganese-transporting P-type ATPase
MTTSKNILKISFFNKKKIIFYGNIIPFLILYILGLYCKILSKKVTFANFEILYVYIYFGVSIFLNIVFTLSTLWSTKLRVLFQYSENKNPKESEFVYVIPKPHKGKEELCQIQKEKEVVYFEYQKIKFFYNEEKKDFFKVNYPDKETMIYYKKLKGLNEVGQITEKYGPNTFQIPNPNYLELLKGNFTFKNTEHVQAPFFIFQMFCCILWSLDE